MSSSGLVLILFTDLVDSTRHSSAIGDVAADDLRRGHFTDLREVLAATGGTEVKTIGDAVMASYTGAADALTGAVAMQRSVERANRRAKGPVLAMRIGISAGDATFEDGDWFGKPVIEASRLCGVADGGQILVSDLVRALAGTRTDNEIRSLGERELKGLPDPVALSEVVWAAGLDHTGLPLPEVVETASAFAFAGRTAELEIARGGDVLGPRPGAVAPIEHDGGFMTTTEPQAQALRRGFGIGALIAFMIVTVAALALGAELWVAVLVGVFIGLFVGGGLGLLVSGRMATESD